MIDVEDYGRVSLGNRKQTPAHRAAYLEWVGPIPDGFHIPIGTRCSGWIQSSCRTDGEAGLHKKLHNLGLAPSLGGIHA